MPVGEAQGKDIRTRGLKPSVNRAPTPDRRSALSRVRPRSSCPRKRSRPLLPKTIRTRTHRSIPGTIPDGDGPGSRWRKGSPESNGAPASRREPRVASRVAGREAPVASLRLLLLRRLLGRLRRRLRLRLLLRRLLRSLVLQDGVVGPLDEALPLGRQAAVALHEDLAERLALGGGLLHEPRGH